MRAPTDSPSDHVPTARPASAAAPSAVVSARRRPRPGCRAGRPGTASGSRWRSRRRRRAARRPEREARRATSATWCAIASSAARTRCARVVPRVMPAISPRASGSQCGDPSPVSAGTRRHAPGRPGLEASRSLSAARRDHAETVAQPLERGAADEHRALELRTAGRAPGATAPPSVSSPCAPAPPRRRRSRARRCPSRTSPSPRRARSTLAEERRLLVARDARDGSVAPRSAASPTTPAEGTTLGQQRPVDAEEREQLVVPLAARRGRAASCATRSSRR